MRRLLPLLLTPWLMVAAVPGTLPTPLRVVVISDFNGAYGSTTYPPALKRVMSRIVNEWKPDLVLSAGDLVAGQKASLTDAQVRAMWLALDRDVHAPLRNAGMPFVFTLGNHDASLVRDRREAASYWARQKAKLPMLDAADYPFRYSLSFQNIFIAVLDASGPNVNAAQRGWLQAQLASESARTASLRLVLGHLPLAGISADKNRPGEIIREAVALRQIMQEGHVNLYLSGHHAAYYPGRLGNLNVLASGGIGGRDYVGHPGTARSTVTLLNLYPGHITFQTFDADTGAEIRTETLPARLDGIGGPLVRVDEFH